MKERWAIDVDGVLADFRTKFFASKHVKSSIAKSMFWRTSPYEFWMSLDALITGEFFQSIVKDRDIIFLTNCPNAVARRDWLKEKGFWNDNCCLWCNAPSESKSNALKMLNPSLFIDDYEKNWKDCADTGVEIFEFDASKPSASWSAIDSKFNKEPRGV